MKWIAKDIETFIKEKEYIDTAVIPLIPLDFSEEMKQSASQAEFITLLTTHLERQFTGRILLLPPFTYLKSETDETTPASILLHWKERIEKSGVRHIFYITSDSDWKAQEEELGHSLLWIPALPLDTQDDTQKMSLIDSQVKQLLNFFMRKWRENM